MFNWCTLDKVKVNSPLSISLSYFCFFLVKTDKNHEQWQITGSDGVEEIKPQPNHWQALDLGQGHDFLPRQWGEW